MLNHVLLLTELAQGPAQPVELAALLGVATGSVTTMLDKLVQKGYATRKPEGNDRRKVLVEISYTEKTSYSNLTKI